jgi:hypothetical protein
MPYRVLIIDECGTIHRISCSKFQKLLFGDGSLPEFANQTVRMAIYYGESENRRFMEVRRSEYSKFKFDAEGRVDENFWNEGMIMVANGINFGLHERSEFEIHREKFQRKRFEETHRWNPTPKEEKRLVDLVLFT